MPLLSNQISLYPLKYARAVLRHMGPEFWIVAVFPYYVSWVWASGDMIPAYGWLQAHPMGPDNFFRIIGGWLYNSREFIAGALVLGPLLGGGTLLYDDYHDHPFDVNNPRKLKLPFFKRPFSPRILLFSGGSLFGLALLLALAISLEFFGIASILVILSILYSTPPVKLKGRAGLDILTNVAGFGILCSFAGWMLVAPLADYPWLWLFIMSCGTAALYIPTTIADAESDEKAGLNTISVRLGPEGAARLGIAFVLMANASIFVLGAMGNLYPLRVMFWFWPVALAQVVLYPWSLRQQEMGNIIGAVFSTTLLMGGGTMLLLMYYTGFWFF